MNDLHRASWLAVTIAVTATSVLPAQSDASATRHTPWFATASHYGRWAALVGAGTLIGLAAARHHEARGQLASLERLCADDTARCAIVSVGGTERYSDSQAEALFRRYADSERAARGLLLGGQLTLVAAGGMFLIDLLYGVEDPPNIPYTPLEVMAEPARFGLRARF